MLSLSPFQLIDLAGSTRSFPSERQSIVCFVKEDCPTCREVMPVLAAMHAALASKLDVLVVGQTVEGNKKLQQDFDLPFSLLDDSALKVSFATDIETVPTLLVTDAAGSVVSEQVGFVRDDWKSLLNELCEQQQSNELVLDWAALPEWRPGCGSLSVDPMNAVRLQAEADNSPIRARRIDLGSQDDEFEFMFDQGFSDGLPVIPPTPERVLRMLSGTTRDPQEVIAVMPPNMGEVTVEKAAINSVMAGCKPEYLPVVLAAIEAVCTDDFNIHGVMATTMGASPVMVINGPIRHSIGMSMGIGALGQGNRANATIGRALRLTIRNVGGAIPGGTERSTLSNPMKFTMCFAEWEERSAWEPLHVERGYQPDESVVTVFAMTSGPVLTVDEGSLDGRALAGTLGQATQTVFNARAYSFTNCLLVVSPEHVDTFKRGDYSKADVRRRMQEVGAKFYRDLVVDDDSGVGLKPAQAAQMGEEKLDAAVEKFKDDSDIHMVVAGSEAGKFTGSFHGWVTGSRGSIPVSKKIGT